MKKLMYLWGAILLLVFAVSCEKSDDAIVVDNLTLGLVDVSFDLNNYIPEIASKDSEKNDGNIPDCSDLPASYVVASISGKSYTLNLVTLNGGLETEVVKLEPGKYNLESFMVYASDGSPIYASPMVDSYYQALWDLEGVTKTFEVDAFTKSKITIDVLCYQPYQYEEFGFVWFEYAKYEVKTICFFGDICTKYFTEWHLDGPYMGQTTNDGYDFAAIFEVVIRDAEGNSVNDLTVNSNAAWNGEGSPLCIEYPDMIGSDENYSFEINLVMPDGSTETIYTADLAEGISSNATTSGFGGADGVFDFVVGNCSYDGNNGNLELPAWIPLPIGNVNFTLSNSLNATGAGFFSKVKFNDLDGNSNFGDTIGEWTEGNIYGAFCGDPNKSIGAGPHNGLVYSSLDVDALPHDFDDLPWGKLNWIANNLGTYSDTQIQDAIWYTIGTNASIGANNQLAQDASGHSDFVPTVGDFAIVLLDAANVGADLQLILVRVDP